MGRVLFLPPEPGTCPICAVNHPADQPHFRDSLYYQMKFRSRFGREPTWADAMAHCAPGVQRIWLGLLDVEWSETSETDEK